VTAGKLRGKNGTDAGTGMEAPVPEFEQTSETSYGIPRIDIMLFFFPKVRHLKPHRMYLLLKMSYF
jgi:hypothetical protein